MKRALSRKTVPGLCTIGRAFTSVSILLHGASPTLSAQPSDTPLAHFWRTDGPVYSVLVTNGVTYLGGAFSYVGPDSGGAGLIDLTSTEARRGFPKIQGTVNAAVSDGAGGWFIGGAFTNVGNAVRTNVAHIRADNVVDPFWAPHLNNICNALLLFNGQLYLGGTFTRVGGITRNRIAAVNPSTGAVATWNPNAGSTVTTLALDAFGTNLYVGGSFTTIGSSNRNRIAALDLSTGFATAWNPSALSTVNAIHADGDTVYVVGSFTTANGIGGQPRNRIAAIDAATGLATDWNPNVTGGSVGSLLVATDVVYIGGSFTSVGGVTRNNLAAIDRVTGLATAWDPNPNTNVNAFARTSEALYVGGGFTNIAGVARRYIAALDMTNGTVFSWAPASSDLDLGITPSVETMAIAANQMLIGGIFASTGGKLRNNIASVANASGEATDWDPNANSTVSILACSGSIIYAGGSFTNIGGQLRNRLAAISNSTSEVTAWDPNVRGRAGAAVLTLALTADTLYAGGINITNVGGQPRTNLFAVQLSDGHPTAWNPAAFRSTTAGSVTKLVIDGSSIVVAGDFTSIGRSNLNNLAALDLGTAALEDWAPNPDRGVSNIVVLGNTVYAGGGFTSIGTVLRNRIGAVDRTTGLGILTWNPDAGSASSTRVNSLLAGNAVLYVGGQFNTLGGAFRTNGTTIRFANGQAGSWSPGFGSMVRSIAAGEGLIFAGGDFLSVAGKPHSYFAAFSTAPEIDPDSLDASSGFFQFQVRGGEATNVVVERSIGNLSSWVPISTNAVTGVNIPFTDPDPIDSTSRFYRAVIAEQ